MQYYILLQAIFCSIKYMKAHYKLYNPYKLFTSILSLFKFFTQARADIPPSVSMVTESWMGYFGMLLCSCKITMHALKGIMLEQAIMDIYVMYICFIV